MRRMPSIASSFGTGRAPGRPRHTGQTLVLGSAPNSTAQPQNIFDRVRSSTWVSMPITGLVRAHGAHLRRRQRRPGGEAAEPLELGGDPEHDLLAERRCHHLEPDRQPGGVETDRHRDGRIADQVRRDGADVGQVHRQGVVGLLAEPERSRGARRRHQHVDLLVGGGEVLAHQRAHPLRLPVEGVVVAGAESVGAEQDAPGDLGAEALAAGRRHHLLGGVPVDPQPVAHPVEASQVRRALGGSDQVVSGERMGDGRQRHLDDLRTSVGEAVDRARGTQRAPRSRSPRRRAPSPLRCGDR